MRLFVAIPVAPPAHDVLTELLDRWRASDWPVKWVRTEGLHLTIKFLGSVGAERISSIREGLSVCIAGTSVLSFTLTEVGAFPTLARARILFAGLECEARLELLVHQIERACAGLGFPVAGHPFRPHVTLGRVREGGRLPAAAVQAMEAAELPALRFVSDQVILYESLPGAGGSRYEARATFPLGTG